MKIKNFWVKKIIQVRLGAAEKFSMSAKVQNRVSKTNFVPSYQRVDLYNLYLKMVQKEWNRTTGGNRTKTFGYGWRPKPGGIATGQVSVATLVKVDV